MLAVLREVQIPLLAVMLLSACAAKAWRALSPRSVTAHIDPTGLFPLRRNVNAAPATPWPRTRRAA